MTTKEIVEPKDDFLQYAKHNIGKDNERAQIFAAIAQVEALERIAASLEKLAGCVDNIPREDGKEYPYFHVEAR